jgi:prolyl 4-hydroxylase
MNRAIDDLELRAKNGDVEAQIALGKRCEDENSIGPARAWFALAAKNGSVDGLKCLAINLLTREPYQIEDGVAMIHTAANRRDGEAAHVCAMLAAQDESLGHRWAIAQQRLEKAAEFGWPSAAAQLTILKQHLPVASSAESERDKRVVSQSPRLVAYDRFATPELCDRLIDLARPRLAPAKVYDETTGQGRAVGARDNSSVTFDIAQSDIALLIVRDRIARAAGLPLSSLEASTVLHYALGQRFETHGDFLDPAAPGHAHDIASHGQRVATFLLYLNDGYEGGETEFPRLSLKFKGRAGDALLFWNVDNSGAPDQRTVHAGRPTFRGEKWVLSQWLRQVHV